MAIELEGKIISENKLVFGEQEGELTPSRSWPSWIST